MDKPNQKKNVVQKETFLLTKNSTSLTHLTMFFGLFIFCNLKTYRHL